MENEQYSLCWDNFHRNMSSGMHSLLENEDLVDVTLAIGGQFLKAHKMVLSICSPYFRRLFAINPHKHPIILMTDVTYPVMSDLLTFMYQGEVEVGQDNLEKFLKTAEALQIKGLTGDNNDRHPSPTRERPIKRPPPPDDHPRPPPYRKLMHPNKKSKPILMEPTPSVTLAPVDNHSLPSITPSSIVEVEHQPPPQHLIKQNILPEFVSDSVNLLRCKAEPVDNTLDQSENSYDHFGDDTADDTMGDDKHYFSSLEEEEPQAGTSADGMGDGQGILFVDGKKGYKNLMIGNLRYVMEKVSGDVIRWKCSKYRYRGYDCRARAITMGQNIVRTSGQHDTSCSQYACY